MARYKEAQDARRGIEEKWLQAYKYYRGVSESLEKRRKENKAGIFVPKLFSRVENATANIVNAILAERPYAMAYPRMSGEENAIQQAANMTTLIDFQLAEVMKFRSRLTLGVRNSLIYGLSPAQTGWKKIVRKATRYLRSDLTGLLLPPEALGEELPPEEFTYDKVIYDWPTIEFFDPFSFFWDAYATEVEDCRYVAVWSLRSKRWLLDRKSVYGTRAVNEALKTRLRDVPSWFTTKRQIMGWTNDKIDEMYEVIQVWEPEGVCTVVNRQAVLEDRVNPFHHGEIPFLKITYNQLEGEFAGLGMVIPALDLQDEINAKRNQRLDNVNLTLNPPMKVIRGTDLTEEDVKLTPGKFIPVDGREDIEPFQVANVTGSAYQEEEYIVRDLNEVTAVHPYQMGMPPEHGRERATTVVALQSAGTAPVQAQVALIEESFLVPLVHQLVALNQQFLSPQSAVKIIDDIGFAEMLYMSREDVEGDFHLVWNGSSADSVAERQFKVNQLINLLGVLERVPGVNLTEYVRKILHLAGIKGINRIIPPQGVAPELEAMEMLQGQEGMMDLEGTALPNQELVGGLSSLRIGATPLEAGTVGQ